MFALHWDLVVDAAEAYLDSRRLMTELALRSPMTVVPACPAWTVHDVASHVTGLAADLVAGNLDGYASEPWTAAQVEARRSHTTEDVVAEWAALPLEPLLADPAGHGLPEIMPTVATVDLLTHVHDVRDAIGRQPPATPDLAAELVLRSLVADLRSRTAHLPPLRISAEGLRDFAVGRGDPKITLQATPYELMRALTGRRSRDEVAALPWTSDPSPYVDVLLPSYFSWPQT